MSLFRKLLLIAKSAGLKIGGGEVSEGGAVAIGWAAISGAGGGAAIWTFPLTGKGAVCQGYGGRAHNVGGVGV